MGHHHCSCRRRSHAGSDSGLIAYDLAAITIALLITGIIWVVMAPLRIWHVTGADGQEHPDTATWIAYTAGGAVIMGALMFFSIRSADKRNRLARVTVKDLRPPPPSVCVQPPACLHLSAVKVDSASDRNLVYRCWCPDCEAELPANFRLLCCAAEPGDGTAPARHVYNCPQLGKVTP